MSLIVQFRHLCLPGPCATPPRVSVLVANSPGILAFNRRPACKGTASGCLEKTLHRLAALAAALAALAAVAEKCKEEAVAVARTSARDAVGT